MKKGAFVPWQAGYSLRRRTGRDRVGRCTGGDAREKRRDGKGRRLRDGTHRADMGEHGMGGGLETGDEGGEVVELERIWKGVLVLILVLVSRVLEEEREERHFSLRLLSQCGKEFRLLLPWLVVIYIVSFLPFLL